MSQLNGDTGLSKVIRVGSLVSRILGLSALPLLVAGAAAASPTATVVINPHSPPVPIGADFSGLSFEVTLVRVGPDGSHYFSPANKPLVALFKTFGIRNIRIGGNTSDRDVKELPTEGDLDSLFQFAKAVDAKVIYCLQLLHADPKADVAFVKYIEDHYEANVECFSIGQEPSAYPLGKTGDSRPPGERMGEAAEKFPYSAYRDLWRSFSQEIIAAAPTARFCGPSVHNNADWAKRFAADFGVKDHVVLITEHLYPGGAGGKVTDPQLGRDRMLDDDFPRVSLKLYTAMAPVITASGLPFRLEEVNSFYNGGAANVSNTYAAALWGLDFMYWWAAHGAEGLNFHSGDNVAAGNSILPSKYAPYVTSPDGYSVRPLGYGIKAFELGGHGTLIPAELAENPENLNLTAYCSRSSDGSMTVTIINKEHGSSGRPASVTVVGSSRTSCSLMFLTAPSGDVAAVDGITLGGSPIAHDGSWNGHWTDGPEADASGNFTISLPMASAVVIRYPAN